MNKSFPTITRQRAFLQYAGEHHYGIPKCQLQGNSKSKSCSNPRKWRKPPPKYPPPLAYSYRLVCFSPVELSKHRVRRSEDKARLRGKARVTSFSSTVLPPRAMWNVMNGGSVLTPRHKYSDCFWTAMEKSVQMDMCTEWTQSGVQARFLVFCNMLTRVGVFSFLLGLRGLPRK